MEKVEQAIKNMPSWAPFDIRIFYKILGTLYQLEPSGGMHFRGLMRKLGGCNTTLREYLDYLIDKRLVTEQKVEMFPFPIFYVLTTKGAITFNKIHEALLYLEGLR